MYIRYYDNIAEKNQIEPPGLSSKWESFKSPFGKDEISFKDIVNFTGVIRIHVKHGGNFTNLFYVESKEEKKEIHISTQFNIPDEMHLLIKELLRAGKRVQLSEYNSDGVAYEFIASDAVVQGYDFIKDYESLLL